MRQTDLLEILTLDGGWLTTDGLALLLPDRSMEALERALWRLRRKGLVKVRSVGLAAVGIHNNVECRREWSVA